MESFRFTSCSFYLFLYSTPSFVVCAEKHFIILCHFFSISNSTNPLTQSHQHYLRLTYVAVDTPLYSNIGKVYSFEYAEIIGVFFTPHHGLCRQPNNATVVSKIIAGFLHLFQSCACISPFLSHFFIGIFLFWRIVCSDTCCIFVYNTLHCTQTVSNIK